MSTCSRCGISAWHPEARTCTIADCDLLATRVTQLTTAPPAADAFQAPGRSLAASAPAPASAGGPSYLIPRMAGGRCRQQFAGDQQADRLRRSAEGPDVHAPSYAPRELATS